MDSIDIDHKTVTIFLAYHKPDFLIKSGVYVPIHLGRDIALAKSKDGFVEKATLDEFMSQTIGDNSGENISKLNRSLNEMTGVYWVWKNYDLVGNPDFVGFAHYRRQFIFDDTLPLPNKRWLPNADVYCFPDHKSAEKYISSQELSHLLEKYDCLATKKYNPNNLNDGRIYRSAKDRFYAIADFKSSLYDEMEQLVLKNHPDYQPEVFELRHNPEHYLFNMFVLKKEIFFDYCQFVFPILFELDRLNDAASSVSTQRAPGFLAEFLTSMFISHQVKIGRVKIKELNTTFIENTNKYQVDNINISVVVVLGYLCSLICCCLVLGKFGTLVRLKKQKARICSALSYGPNYVTFCSMALIKVVNKLARVLRSLANLMTLN